MKYFDLETKEKLFVLLKVSLRGLIPILLFFYCIWQSIIYANLTREIKKKSIRREELYKKNFDLKAKISSQTTLEKIETLYNKSLTKERNFTGNKIITLTLPKEKP
ncbi:MAG: hypothetical protein SFU98_19265 [Leptospiraceae bacterium]|nr:hypothetical protein [Leptospiraceae bacterium]